VPSWRMPHTRLAGDGYPLLDLLVDAGATASKGEARRLLEGGGIYLNNVQQGDVRRVVAIGDLLAGAYLVLRRGRRQYTVVEVQA